MIEVAAKERPIIMSGPMVRAILEDRKTQTRRVVKPQPPTPEAVRALAGDDYSWWTDHHSPGAFRPVGPVWAVRKLDEAAANKGLVCPYGQPGDRLWVRETFSDPFPLDVECRNFTGFYRATDPDRKVKWMPSIFMPRWASRITLEITGVRVERLQQVSEEAAIAEGVDAIPIADAPRQAAWNRRQDFSRIWDHINGPGSWDANPWIWVIEFRRPDG